MPTKKGPVTELARRDWIRRGRLVAVQLSDGSLGAEGVADLVQPNTEASVLRADGWWRIKLGNLLGPSPSANVRPRELDGIPLAIATIGRASYSIDRPKDKGLVTVGADTTPGTLQTVLADALGHQPSVSGGRHATYTGDWWSAQLALRALAAAGIEAWED